MYTFELDTPEANRHLARTLRLIEHLEDSDVHGWILQAPDLDSEVATLQSSVPREPVDLVDTLRTGMMSALEALAHIRFSIDSRHYTLTGLQSMMRTALMGVGRVGYVVLPDGENERIANATMVLTQEARSLSDALDDIQKISTIPGLKTTQDHEAELRHQIDQHAIKGRGVRDRGMIRKAAELIGVEAARTTEEVDGRELRDHVTWIWNTASGAAHGFHWQTMPGGDFVTDIGAVAASANYVLDATKRSWTTKLRASS